jgi:hypothetical protein
MGHSLKLAVILTVWIDRTEFNWSNNEVTAWVPEVRGKDVPGGTMAVVRSSDFLRGSQSEGTALATLIHQRRYAIMRRAGPYRGENSGPGKDRSPRA